MAGSCVYVLHENPEWLPPIAAALDARGVRWQPWLLTGEPIELTAAPPHGVFWSRMSASAGSRGHTEALEQARGVLAWLEAAGRPVVNGRRVLELELSKVDQLVALAAAGIDVPRTIAVSDPARVDEAARSLGRAAVVKPNRGGKGLGVARWVDGSPPPDSPDGVVLVQEYLPPADGSITRVELVGGRFLYAVRADVVRGGFELCPADACAADGSSLFSLRAPGDVDAGLVSRYETFAAEHGIGVAGFEYLTTADGRHVTYDINTNTNYNPDVERSAERSGPAAVAEYLDGLSRQLDGGDD